MAATSAGRTADRTEQKLSDTAALLMEFVARLDALREDQQATARALQESRIAQGEQLAALNDTVAALDLKITRVALNLAKLDARLTALEEKVPALQSQITSLESQLVAPRGLVNLSTRAMVSTGDGITIGGLSIAGPEPRTVLIRAVGPTLANFGISGVLADPTIEIPGTTTANDDWSADLAPVMERAGAFALPAGSKDAALVATLAPGNHTVHVRGAGGATGIALLEIYELAPE